MWPTWKSSSVVHTVRWTDRGSQCQQPNHCPAVSGVWSTDLVRILDEIKSDASGLALLADWLGENGVPVDKVKAVLRSSICAKCPENIEPNWWQKFTTSIAMTIRRQLGIKHRLKLEVPQEKELRMCRVCGCATPLKIWTPIEHIKSHTSVGQMQRFPNFCWIKKETEAA